MLCWAVAHPRSATASSDNLQHWPWLSYAGLLLWQAPVTFSAKSQTKRTQLVENFNELLHTCLSFRRRRPAQSSISWRARRAVPSTKIRSTGRTFRTRPWWRTCLVRCFCRSPSGRADLQVQSSLPGSNTIVSLVKITLRVPTSDRYFSINICTRVLMRKQQRE